MGGIVCIASSNGGTTSQDLKTGFLVGATPRLQQISILIGALRVGAAAGPILLKLNDTATVYVPVAQVAPQGLTTDVAALAEKRESVQGRAGAGRCDRPTASGTRPTSTAARPASTWWMTPARRCGWWIRASTACTTTRPDGTEVRKFDAPKATLMSYIIKGILDRELPWGLVLFGVMIAVVLEISGVPSLAFAVGVYLPISSTSPIFIGGLIRWLVDRRARREPAAAALDRGTSSRAQSDRGPGVLMASGYIAGGAIAGIVIAFLAGVLGNFDAALQRWSTLHNPFYEGPLFGPAVHAAVPAAGSAALARGQGQLAVRRRRTRPAECPDA